jgi:hypothetical protein
MTPEWAIPYLKCLEKIFGDYSFVDVEKFTEEKWKTLENAIFVRSFVLKKNTSYDVVLLYSQYVKGDESLYQKILSNFLFYNEVEKFLKKDKSILLDGNPDEHVQAFAYEIFNKHDKNFMPNTIFEIQNHTNEIIKWLYINCSGKWNLNQQKLMFENKEDAALFKLVHL